MMVFRSAAAGVRIAVAAGCVAVLAGCSTVTYGTGVPTTAQTVRDVAGMLDVTPDVEIINYEQRPGLETPSSTTLPPPQEPVETAPTQPAAQPANTQTCAIAPGQVAPPPEYCTPDPDAPAVAANDGVLGIAGSDGIREPTNVCSWYTLSWAEMSAEEQAQWGRLGWNAGNWGSADPALRPASATAGWSDLSLRERGAARRLGFDQNSWGACLV